MDDRTSKWAFILGGSGAFGLASAKALAKEGFNLILVFRERRSGMTQKEGSFRELESMCKVIRFNLNANEAENQEKILGELCEHADVAGNIRFVLHALADGNLRPLFRTGKKDIEPLNAEDFKHTLEAMGTGMLRWTQLLLERGLLKGPASVVGLSSEGSSRYLPDYAAVAAAKAVMISNMQYMAVELAGTGIRVNLVNAGITDTDALKAFPSYHEFLEKAKKRNPSGRLTTPEDIAPVITFLASPASAWVNGSVITADGGEQLMSLN